MSLPSLLTAAKEIVPAIIDEIVNTLGTVAGLKFVGTFNADGTTYPNEVTPIEGNPLPRGPLSRADAQSVGFFLFVDTAGTPGQQSNAPKVAMQPQDMLICTKDDRGTPIWTPTKLGTPLAAEQVRQVIGAVKAAITDEVTNPAKAAIAAEMTNAVKAADQMTNAVKAAITADQMTNAVKAAIRSREVNADVMTALFARIAPKVWGFGVALVLGLAGIGFFGYLTTGYTVKGLIDSDTARIDALYKAAPDKAAADKAIAAADKAVAAAAANIALAELTKAVAAADKTAADKAVSDLTKAVSDLTKAVSSDLANRPR